MTILDGRTLAQKILTDLKPEVGKRKLSLAVIVVGGDAVIQKFIAQKKKTAEDLGVDFWVYEHDAAISTNELRKRLSIIVHDADPDGVIIQLPLPGHISAQYILNSVPPQKDVDVLSARAIGDFAVGKSKIEPPVVGAVKALFEEYNIDYRSKYHVIVGAGTLVGKPMAAWLLNEKISFSLLEERTADISEFTKKADILVSGVGKPGLITGGMVKDGVVVIDCGTSVSHQPPATSDQPEAGSQKLAAALAGDVDFYSVSKKALFITPVPGGIGPLTVAMIFKNLAALVKM